MSRQVTLLVAVGFVLVGVAFYFFLWQPRSDQIAEIESQIEQADLQQIQLRQRINTLQDTRDRAPDIEAAIVAAESIVPRDVGVPAALRQLVLAADDSGVDLLQVSPSRPSPFVGSEEPGVAVMSMSLQVEGGYFQLVDFLRRIEDPTISPRGFVWTSLSVAPAAYPTLSASVTGAMYAVLPTVAAPPAEEAPAEETPAEETPEEEAP